MKFTFINILLIVFILGGIIYFNILKDFHSSDTCKLACSNQGYSKGECLSSSVHNSEYKDIGMCVISSDGYCKKKGECDCYCYN